MDYTTGDLESPLADIHFDLHNIPFEDDLFDVVICNHVLEHVEDDRKCMREIYRILKKGGFAILQVPVDYTREHTFEDSSVTDPKERERLFWQVDHLRLYGRDYGQILRSVGFYVTESDFVKDISEKEIKRMRLPAKEVLYFCEKV